MVSPNSARNSRLAWASSSSPRISVSPTKELPDTTSPGSSASSDRFRSMPSSVAIVRRRRKSSMTRMRPRLTCPCVAMSSASCRPCSVPRWRRRSTAWHSQSRLRSAGRRDGKRSAVQPASQSSHCGGVLAGSVSTRASAMRSSSGVSTLSKSCVKRSRKSCGVALPCAAAVEDLLVAVQLGQVAAHVGKTFAPQAQRGDLGCGAAVAVQRNAQPQMAPAQCAQLAASALHQHVEQAHAAGLRRAVQQSGAVRQLARLAPATRPAACRAAARARRRCRRTSVAPSRRLRAPSSRPTQPVRPARRSRPG